MAGRGSWVEDDRGVEYLDLIGAYSALNFGHCHPRIVEAAAGQLRRLSVTSRAVHHDLLGPFCRELASLCGMEYVVPMNTGAEAVETAADQFKKEAGRTDAGGNLVLGASA